MESMASKVKERLLYKSNPSILIVSNRDPEEAMRVFKPVLKKGNGEDITKVVVVAYRTEMDVGKVIYNTIGKDLIITDDISEEFMPSLRFLKPIEVRSYSSRISSKASVETMSGQKTGNISTTMPRRRYAAGSRRDDSCSLDTTSDLLLTTTAIGMAAASSSTHSDHSCSRSCDSCSSCGSSSSSSFDYD